MKELGATLGLIFLFCCVSVNAQESMRFDNEGKKLQFIRHMLSKEKNLRLIKPCPSACAQMMKDLLADKNFEAIEPDVRADSADDPRLKKWDQCHHKDYHDFPEVGVRDFFGWLPGLGDPPYRYYRIELDGNKANGPEDMIYVDSSIRSNQPGYTWVNLDKCEIQAQYATTGSIDWLPERNPIVLNLLVYYRGEPWIIKFDNEFHFELKSIAPSRMATCSWLLFKPE